MVFKMYDSKDGVAKPKFPTEPLPLRELRDLRARFYPVSRAKIATFSLPGNVYAMV